MRKTVDWDEVEEATKIRYRRSYIALSNQGTTTRDLIETVAEDSAHWNRMYRELASDVFDDIAFFTQWMAHQDNCYICRTGTKCKQGLAYYRKAYPE
jgi:hypothetical protein